MRQSRTETVNTMSTKKISARKISRPAFQKRYSGWAPIVRKLKAGKYPDRSELAETFRSMEIPEIPTMVRDHIAGLIDGTIKLPKGRKKQDSFRDIAENAAVQMRYQEELDKFRKEEELAAARTAKGPKQIRRRVTSEKKSTADQRALKVTAAAFFRSEDWVKDRIYDRLFRDKWRKRRN